MSLRIKTAKKWKTEYGIYYFTGILILSFWKYSIIIYFDSPPVL